MREQKKGSWHTTVLEITAVVALLVGVGGMAFGATVLQSQLGALWTQYLGVPGQSSLYKAKGIVLERVSTYPVCTVALDGTVVDTTDTGLCECDGSDSGPAGGSASAPKYVSITTGNAGQAGVCASPTPVPTPTP